MCRLQHSATERIPSASGAGRSRSSRRRDMPRSLRSARSATACPRSPPTPPTRARWPGARARRSRSRGRAARPASPPRRPRPPCGRWGSASASSPQPQCAAVAPLTTSTGAPSGLAAAFSVTEAAGAPPFYLAALVTHDNGQTWAPIPVPHGSGPAGFGGFRYAGATLEAVFAAGVKGAPGPIRSSARPARSPRSRAPTGSRGARRRSAARPPDPASPSAPTSRATAP